MKIRRVPFTLDQFMKVRDVRDLDFAVRKSQFEVNPNA